MAQELPKKQINNAVHCAGTDTQHLNPATGRALQRLPTSAQHTASLTSPGNEVADPAADTHCFVCQSDYAG